MAVATLPSRSTSKSSHCDAREEVVKLIPRVSRMLDTVDTATLPSQLVEQNVPSTSTKIQYRKTPHDQESPNTELADENTQRQKSECKVQINKLLIMGNTTVEVTASMLLNLPMSKYRSANYYDELHHQGTDCVDRLSEYSRKMELYWPMDHPMIPTLMREKSGKIL